MIVVAGPPGSGKSSRFPLASFGIVQLNADDRAAELNGRSYIGISPEIRAVVNQEFEQFVHAHIQSGQSFAIETTLRSGVTFDQARMARSHGFQTLMLFVALNRVDLNLERVANRADAGGHSAPASMLRSFHERSTANLALSLSPTSGLQLVIVYDNSAFGDASPSELLRVFDGRPTYLTETPPAWLEQALRNSPYDLRGLRLIIDQASDP